MRFVPWRAEAREPIFRRQHHRRRPVTPRLTKRNHYTPVVSLREPFERPRDAAAWSRGCPSVPGHAVAWPKHREGATVRKKAVYVALGMSLTGEREVLGLWFQQTEGAKF